MTTVSAQSYMWEMSAPTLYRSWMSDRRSVVNIARRVDLQSRHSYPFSLLIISGRISLKQRNEQVDYWYMLYLLMTLFSWNMAPQQLVKCNWLGGELGGRWHDSDQCCGQQDVLPWRRLVEKESPQSRKIIPNCIENTQYNLFPRLVGM